MTCLVNKFNQYVFKVLVMKIDFDCPISFWPHPVLFALESPSTIYPRGLIIRVGRNFSKWGWQKWALGVIIHMGPCVNTKNFRPLGGVLADLNAFKDFDFPYIRPFFQNCPRELKFLWRSFLTSL